MVSKKLETSFEIMRSTFPSGEIPEKIGFSYKGGRHNIFLNDYLSFRLSIEESINFLKKINVDFPWVMLLNKPCIDDFSEQIISNRDFLTTGNFSDLDKEEYRFNNVIYVKKIGNKELLIPTSEYEKLNS